VRMVIIMCSSSDGYICGDCDVFLN
jgi:hypothetical protein